MIVVIHEDVIHFLATYEIISFSKYKPSVYTVRLRLLMHPKTPGRLIANETDGKNTRGLYTFKPHTDKDTVFGQELPGACRGNGRRGTKDTPALP